MQNANIEPELSSLRTKLAAEIDADSKQIEFLKKKIDKNQILLTAIKGSLGALHPESKTSGYGAKSEIIGRVIKSLTNNQFTQDDIEAEIRSSYPNMEINRNRIRAALWTLANKHKRIKQITQGNNRQPAIYEKMQSPPPRQKRSNEQADNVLTLGEVK